MGRRAPLLGNAAFRRRRAFRHRYRLDAAKLPPIVTWGTSPEDVIAITGKVPNPAEIADLGRVRHLAGDRDHVFRRRAPGDDRRQLCRIQAILGVEMRAVVGKQCFPVAARVPDISFGAFDTSFRNSNAFSSGAMRPARAPPSTDMLQTVMRPSIDSRAERLAGVFQHVAGTPWVPNLARKSWQG